MDQESILLDPKAFGQLQLYGAKIASMYQHDQPLHNFKHASHVSMFATPRPQTPKSQSNLEPILAYEHLTDCKRQI